MLSVHQRHGRTDGQTDGRTDGHYDSNTALALRASRGKNVAMADKIMVLNHKDETQINHSTHPVAQFAVVWIIFSQ